MHPSSSSSHYLPSGGYDDLRLPPIRNPVSYSSSTRAHASPRHVTTMEPPTFTSSTAHLRKSSVTLPPLANLEQRPRTSLGYSSHTFGPSSSSLPFGPTPRHVSQSSHMNTLPPISTSYRPSSSSHRGGSFSVNTSSYDDHPVSYPVHSHHLTNMPQSPGYQNSHDANSPNSTRAFTCDLCGATFSRAYDCKRHRDIHTRQGGHECPSCHKTLSRADALKRHKERGCSGSGIEEEDFDEIERERERDRVSKERRRQKSQSIGGDASSKYYYTSNTRPR